MSEEEKTKGIIAGLLSLINKDTRDFFNIYLIAFIPMLVIMAVMGVQKIVEKIGEPTEKCWAIEHVGDQYIKLNKCTGETKPFDPKKNN